MPQVIIPPESIVHDLRGSVDPLWLISGSWIGPFHLSIQPIPVEGSGSDVFNSRVEISVPDGFHCKAKFARFYDMYFNLVRPRSPDEKTTSILL